jgi:hypothetical protein
LHLIFKKINKFIFLNKIFLVDFLRNFHEKPRKINQSLNLALILVGILVWTGRNFIGIFLVRVKNINIGAKPR